MLNRPGSTSLQWPVLNCEWPKLAGTKICEVPVLPIGQTPGIILSLVPTLPALKYIFDQPGLRAGLFVE
jgi:hypothetical protein